MDRYPPILKKGKRIVNSKRKAYWKGKRKLCAFSKGDCGWKGGKEKEKKSSPILEDREVQKINKRSSFQEETKDGGNAKKNGSSIL